jgi:hypothetical protein
MGGGVVLQGSISPVSIEGNGGLGGILIFCINRLDHDEPVRVGGNQGMKVLIEMNELQEFKNENWNTGSV